MNQTLICEAWLGTIVYINSIRVNICIYIFYIIYIIYILSFGDVEIVWVAKLVGNRL